MSWLRSSLEPAFLYVFQSCATGRWVSLGMSKPPGLWLASLRACVTSLLDESLSRCRAEGEPPFRPACEVSAGRRGGLKGNLRKMLFGICCAELEFCGSDKIRSTCANRIQTWPLRAGIMGISPFAEDRRLRKNFFFFALIFSNPPAVKRGPRGACG